MKMTVAALGLVLMTVSHAHVRPPSEGIIAACLEGEGNQQTRRVAIDTAQVTLTDSFRGGYRATLWTLNGVEVGYAETTRRAALVWGRHVIALTRAIAIDKPRSTPTAFTPSLADWSVIEHGTQRFLCVNFNFDGLGRSGSFQRVHGLYLLEDPAGRHGSPSLFYTVREAK